MKYYVTIYIDQLFGEIAKDFEILKLNFSDLDFTHAFLGLTKDKTPNELDKQDETLRREKLKNADWKDFDKKWHESLEANEFNDGFWGFGSGTGGSTDAPGKVFANNHCVMNNNTQTNQYEFKKFRSDRTFKPSNRCTLEISQEQYETLLESIKQDFKETSFVKPNTSLDDIANNTFIYNIFTNNCVTWVIKKLSDIGIEIINEAFKIPSHFINLFNGIKILHNIFLKFQNIDDNLKSIEGAKAFRTWARTMLDNHYTKKEYLDNHKKVKNRELSKDKEEILLALFNISSIYSLLDKMLQSRLDKLDKLGYGINAATIKGDFEFIYFDKQSQSIKSLKAENNYRADEIKSLDLTNPANNFSVSKFYPFIFTPKDEKISRVLYHQYDYGKVSEGYQNDANKFYSNVLAGIQSDEFWSSSYHKLSKTNKQFQIQTKEAGNV